MVVNTSRPVRRGVVAVLTVGLLLGACGGGDTPSIESGGGGGDDEGLASLAKATNWREELRGTTDAFAVIEIAYDRKSAERSWQDNVPDDLERRDDELPAEPGLYGDLDDIDFDRQAVIVWSSGESGSCPGWLADIDTRDGTVHVERDATQQECTDDYNPYRMVLAVARDRLPESSDLPHERIEGVPDGEIRNYPENDG